MAEAKAEEDVGKVDPVARAEELAEGAPELFLRNNLIPTILPSLAPDGTRYGRRSRFLWIMWHG